MFDQLPNYIFQWCSHKSWLWKKPRPPSPAQHWPCMAGRQPSRRWCPRWAQLSEWKWSPRSVPRPPSQRCPRTPLHGRGWWRGCHRCGWAAPVGWCCWPAQWWGSPPEAGPWSSPCLTAPWSPSGRPSRWTPPPRSQRAWESRTAFLNSRAECRTAAAAAAVAATTGSRWSSLDERPSQSPTAWRRGQSGGEGSGERIEMLDTKDQLLPFSEMLS